MIVVLSGEGPSDLGQCTNAQGECRIPQFAYGPMTLVVDKIIEDQFYYSPLESSPESYVYINEERLHELEAERKQARRQVSLVGKKRDQETGYFYINAWMFGEETLRLQNDDDGGAIGVLFRDSDGTRSAVKGLWDAKVDSMIGGFDRSGLSTRGVPMVPKPKSEAWLLCAARPRPYIDCAALEQRSGNDNSPNSLKQELASVLQGEATTQRQLDWMINNGFDHAAVAGQMNSFAAFKHRLHAALAAL